jgi:hypothetical protein
MKMNRLFSYLLTLTVNSPSLLDKKHPMPMMPAYFFQKTLRELRAQISVFLIWAHSDCAAAQSDEFS